MLKIKHNFGSDLNSLDFQQITTSQVKKFLKEIYIKETVVLDAIPTKLIKIGADIIVEPLTQAVNGCWRQGIFPDNAKITSVVPVDKAILDKFDVINYRPVSIFNTFSKRYEKVIKNQLVS